MVYLLNAFMMFSRTLVTTSAIDSICERNVFIDYW